MKRIIVSSCLLSLSAISLATYATTPSSNNLAFATQPKYEISVRALYLQPSSTFLDYAVHGYPFPVQSPSWSVSAVEPNYSAGFALGARYYLPNSKNDLHVSWDHLSTSDSDSTFSKPGQFVVMMFQTGPSAGQSLNNPSQQAHATAQFNYDVINIDAGRFIDYDANTQFRLFLGISGAQIRENLSATFRDNAATFSINNTSNSKFNGIGPLFGVDGQYKMSCGLGVLGSASFSALVGKINALTSFTSRSPQLSASGITRNYQTISPINSTQVVPGFDGKLGLNYSHGFYKDGVITAALGYEYAAYMNAIAAYTPSTVFGNINTGTIALASLQKSVSNFSVQGPFFNLALDFA